MPTIVAIATGKKTMSEQMTTLLTRPGPNHSDEQRREGEDRDRLGGDEVRRGEALDERAAGQRVADDEAERRTDGEARG